MIEQLKAYVEENDLCSKALNCFWIAFDNWKKDDPETYAEKFHSVPIEAMDVFVHAIGLRSSQWPECSYSHVTITIKIHHNDRAFGNYACWFSLSNDVDDDDFLEIM